LVFIVRYYAAGSHFGWLICARQFFGFACRVFVLRLVCGPQAHCFDNAERVNSCHGERGPLHIKLPIDRKEVISYGRAGREILVWAEAQKPLLVAGGVASNKETSDMRSSRALAIVLALWGAASACASASDPSGGGAPTGPTGAVLGPRGGLATATAHSRATAAASNTDSSLGALPKPTKGAPVLRALGAGAAPLYAEAGQTCSADTNCSGNEFCDAGVCRARSCNLSDPFGSMTRVLPGITSTDGFSLSADELTAVVSRRTGSNYDLFVTTRFSKSASFTEFKGLTNTNTSWDERAPFLSPDGLRVYFYTRIGANSELAMASRNLLQDDFGGAVLFPPPLESSASDEDPYLTPDEQTMVFASDRPTGDRHLYMATKGQSGFGSVSQIANVGWQGGDMRPVLSRDKLRLYFGSRRAGFMNDTDGDIWLAVRADTGHNFNAPTNLTSLNWTGAEFPVGLSADGCSLYLASNREHGAGGVDSYEIYRAQRQPTPSMVTITLNVTGGAGHSVGTPFNCNVGNTGTCSVQQPFGSDPIVLGNAQSRWTGLCSPNGPQPSTDGIVNFSVSGVCNVSFPAAAGETCVENADCTGGLYCVGGVCRTSCTPACLGKACGDDNGCGTPCACGTKGEGDPCGSSSECSSGLICESPRGGGPTVCTDSGIGDAPDSDCDGISDKAELAHGLNPNDPSDRNADPDGDGLRTVDELRAGSNPLVADADPTGASLLVNRDLDGDGVPFQNDNCPKDANANQRDTDGDGVGDVCDPDPTQTGVDSPMHRIIVARDALGGFALLDGGSADSQRLASDQRGLLPWGSSFRVLAFPATNSVEMAEYFNTSTGHHAYASTTADKATLAANGFASVGTVGYLGSTSLPFGDWTLVRHFTKGSGAARQDAVTADANEASTFLSLGYSELATFGYGTIESGHLSKPVGVIRYRLPSTGRTVHLAGPVSTDFVSEGFQFAVLPEPNGWTRPLYRLHDAAGREAFATNTTDRSSLIAAGYVWEGNLGYVYTAHNADTLESLVPLMRVQRGVDYALTVHATELAELHAQGYSGDVVLGYAVRAPAKLLATSGCTSAPDPLQSLFDEVSSAGGASIMGNAAVLGELNHAATLTRVANGQVSTDTEQAVAADWANTDPQSRLMLLARAQRELSLSAAERASLLGVFAGHDPGNGTTAVDYSQSVAVMHTLGVGADMPGGPNGGFNYNGTSNAHVRAPQCQGGVTYSDSVSTPDQAARAVTIRDGEVYQVCNSTAEGTFCTDRTANVKPELYGVLRTGTDPQEPGSSGYSPLDPPNAYADAHSVPGSHDPAHDLVGIPLIGIDVGACDSGCSELAGERCTNGRCRAYPMVPQNSTVTLSASNLWDLKTAIFQLTDIDSEFVAYDDGFEINIPRVNADVGLACEPNPVLVNSGIAPPPPPPPPTQVLCENVHPTCPDPCFTSDEFETCIQSAGSATNSYKACTTGGPYCTNNADGNCYIKNGQCVRNVILVNPDPYSASGAESGLEQAQITLPPLASAGHFYSPRVINMNGSYFHAKDTVPDSAPVGTGRTIHLCVRGSGGTDPDCEPPPDATLAACPLAPLPNCGGAVGGIWNRPPRSLAACQQSATDDLGPCPETPLQFPSDTVVDGLPLLMYVVAEDTKVDIQTRLVGIHCLDETGGDALGSDELLVRFTGTSQVTNRTDSISYAESIDAGDRHFPQFAVNLRSALHDGKPSTLIVDWIEQDATSASQWAAATGASASSTVVAYFGGAGPVPTIISTVGSFIATFILAKGDFDDRIGRSEYTMTPTDVMERGQRLHAGGLQDVPRLEVSQAGNMDVAELNVSKHPSVDLRMYASNNDVMTCANDAGCFSGNHCVLGACVTTSWQDRSEPIGFDVSKGDLAGTIEERKYRPGGAKYDTFLSTSIQAVRN
jgi:hypothetical protein